MKSGVYDPAVNLFSPVPGHQVLMQPYAKRMSQGLGDLKVKLLKRRN